MVTLSPPSGVGGVSGLGQAVHTQLHPKHRVESDSKKYFRIVSYMFHTSEIKTLMGRSQVFFLMIF